MGLGLGDEGDSVSKVQTLLNKYGYLSSGNVTGYYGEITENAVRSFQNRNGLSVDGTVGAQTMAKLTGDNVTKAPAGGSSSGGSSGGSSGSNRGGSSGGSSGSNRCGTSSAGSSGGSSGGTLQIAVSVLSLFSVSHS